MKRQVGYACGVERYNLPSTALSPDAEKKGGCAHLMQLTVQIVLLLEGRTGVLFAKGNLDYISNCVSPW